MVGGGGGGGAFFFSTHLLPRELASRLFTLLWWVTVGVLLQNESRIDGLFIRPQ